MPEKADFHIVYEDDFFFAVNKLAGVPVIPERKPGPVKPLIQQFREKYSSNVQLVHRIDKDTSGLLLLAKSETSQKALSQLFFNKQISKHYLAVVEGKLYVKKWASIDFPIFKKQNSVKVSIDPKGKPARTLYRTLELFKQSSLVELKILTGRTHQIRIHLSHLEHPLLVDPLYGNRTEFYLSELLGKRYKKARGKEERPLIGRQTLHAHSIQFIHPVSGKEIKLTADLPKDWRALLKQLKKTS